jgi:DNA-binding protein WhiA
VTSEDVREELARIAPDRECDRRAELCALFHAAGSLHLRGRGEWALQLDLATGFVARRAFLLLRAAGVRSEIRTYRRPALDRVTRYQLIVEGGPAALRALVGIGVLDSRRVPLERPPRPVLERPCCRRAYLRGAFLGGGSLSCRHSPHLELRTASLETAAVLSDVARREGLPLGVLERPSHAAAYAKGWDVIESFLASVGAGETVLALEERAVLAATRARANRLANADHANLVRTTRAAYAQLDAARRLRVEGRLERLPYRLREAGELRLRHPTLSLRELAARTDPPVSKASIYRRLRRLEELASR